MADERAVFAIDLEDGTSSTAESAAGALKRLRDQIDADQKALRDMQKAMRNLQGGTQVNIQQFRQLKAAIDAKKQAIAENTSEVLALGGSLSRTRSSGRGMHSMLQQLTQASGQLPGPLGGIVSRLGGLRALVTGGAIVLGIAAIAAAFVGLAAGAVAASVALARYAVAQGNAARSELLRLEGLTKLRNWYGIAAGSASELQNMIDRVSASSALGRDQVAQYAQQLYQAHLRGQNLSDALELVTTVASTQGQEVAKRYAGWAASLNMAGGSVRKLADDVRSRLGGIANRQLLDLDVQAMKARESLAALFGNLHFEGLLGALNQVTTLLSQNTVTGRALKTLMESIFGPLDTAAARLGPIMKRFFQGMVVGALLVQVAVLKVRNWFRDTFGDSKILSGIDLTRLALYAGVLVVSMLTGGLVTLAAVVATLLSPFAALAGALWGLINLASLLFDVFVDTDWAALGSAIIDGIVGGLERGAKWVIDTIKNLGTSAWSAFKESLGIASPSKEFAKLGLAIPQGVQQGVDDGEPAVRRSVEHLVSLPSEPSIPAGAENDGTGSAPAVATRTTAPSISMSFGNIVVQGGTSEEQVDNFRRKLEAALETVAIQLGARPQRGTA